MASCLSDDERAELAQYLLDSLETMHREVRAEWVALAQRRMAEVRASTIVGRPADDVLKNLLAH